MMLTEGWAGWKGRQLPATRAKADDLQELVFSTGPSSFWSRADEAIALLGPALKMVRALETDLPTSHIVYDLGSQVTECTYVCVLLHACMYAPVCEYA
jgi:hypothetical protein